MKKLAAGNWKMNGSLNSLSEIKTLATRHTTSAIDILICVPAPYLIPALQLASPLQIGAQDCHHIQKGAHTGDISAAMIADTGATYVIVGHSERRADHNETDALVRQKALAAQGAGLCPIICIGETLEERESGQALKVIQEQLEGSLDPALNSSPFVIAYEPVWAIGTGLVPSASQIEEVHGFCRRHLVSEFGSTAVDVPLLYGGSVKGSNAAEIFAVKNVDGALVGGASLRADDFSAILDALENA